MKPYRVGAFQFFASAGILSALQADRSRRGITRKPMDLPRLLDMVIARRYAKLIAKWMGLGLSTG
jgi:hypothetical protein